ncbi:MAG: hypothetical protein JWM98_2546 [Thermoleophilia bacterium]|nr:hypothetical protein [Thermoleophilia bacterium]
MDIPAIRLTTLHIAPPKHDPAPSPGSGITLAGGGDGIPFTLDPVRGMRYGGLRTAPPGGGTGTGFIALDPHDAGRATTPRTT